MSDIVLGFKELEAKLKKLETATAEKALRSAAMAATLPVTKEMAAAAPRGSDTHRTYKGRLVAPGFLSRSVKRASKIKNGIVSISIGVKREAFYGVTFLDKGTDKLKGHEWFVSRFENNETKIISEFKKKLAARIKKASK